MKHRPLALALALVLGGHTAAMAQKPRPEIGFRGGLNIFRESGSNLTVFSIPGSSLFTLSTVHATLFATPALALEPQAGILRVSSGGSSSGAFTGGIQANQFVGDAERGAPFGFLNTGFVSSFGGGGTEFAAGGGAGYRTVLAENLGVRVEARYRRWFRSDMDEFSVLIGLGAILGRRE